MPIYVESLWPNAENPIVPSRVEGLRRLGTWDAVQGKVIVDQNDKTQQLVKNNARIAHVALVYSNLEEGEPSFMTPDIAAAMTAIYSFRYADLRGLCEILFQDAKPLLENMAEDAKKWLEHPSLSVRQPPLAEPVGHPTGLDAVIAHLNNDVAAYVCQNGRRQRVRTWLAPHDRSFPLIHDLCDEGAFPNQLLRRWYDGTRN